MYNYLVEFLGTILFTFVVIATGNPLAIGTMYALIQLLTMGMVTGYLNPAITIVLASAGVITKIEIIYFCLAQVLGALVALYIYQHKDTFF
jgi:glycerol uptake facilitator-like aquaporin